LGKGTLATRETASASLIEAASTGVLIFDNIDPRLTALFEIASMGCFSFKNLNQL
jgi:hypothetical protein